MSAAFLWMMADEDRVVYLVLHKRIAAEIRLRDGEFDQASVSEHPDGLVAQDFALRLTEFWAEKQGFMLVRIITHTDPEGSMIAGSLRTARDLALVHEDVTHLCQTVVSRFWADGEVLV